MCKAVYDDSTSVSSDTAAVVVLGMSDYHSDQIILDTVITNFILATVFVFVSCQISDKKIPGGF